MHDFPISPIRMACLAWILLAGSSITSVATADDQLRLRDICRLKGQEVNYLQGLGLVVGLNGTGDNQLNPTTRSLARMLQNMGGNIAIDGQGIPELRELEETSNVALVLVTASVPPAGAQQGDQLNCEVSAVNAKSLEGGRLVMALLLGPRADVPTVYAICNGPVSIPDPKLPTSGVIYNGCKMEATIENQFVHNGKLTLILDKDIASFSAAIDIKDSIDSLNQSGLSAGNGASDTLVIAQAIDQSHIEVAVPSAYTADPVKFVSLVLDIPLPHIKKSRRVVINEREGVIVIGEDVLINPVAINHKNLSIEARPNSGGFVPIDTESPGGRPKLKNLIEALNALNVPTQDVISIVRTLKRNGDLYGEVVMQ
ncbi:MAG: flagellar basal body P-ring protein FlgI [Pirellulaceae bacterium]